VFVVPAVVALVALFAGPARAQPRQSDLKGFALQQSIQKQQQQAARPESRPPAAAPARGTDTPAAPATEVHIAIAVPASPNPPAAIAIRGPDGEVRRFPVEGGQAALRSTVIVVRPGDRVTVQLIPAAAPKK
jgi:hypothetical protein